MKHYNYHHFSPVLKFTQKDSGNDRSNNSTPKAPRTKSARKQTSHQLSGEFASSTYRNATIFAIHAVLLPQPSLPGVPHHHVILLYVRLGIIQKRSSLAVLSVMGRTNLLSEEAWDGNNEGCEEENCHNGEGKDPLEGNGPGEELTNSKRSAEDAESESHGIILLLLTIFAES